MEKLLAIIEYPKIKLIGTFCLVFLSRLFGTEHIFFEALLIMIIIDSLTGLMKGFYQKKVSSQRMIAIGGKIIRYALIIIAAHQLVRIAPVMRWFEEGIIIWIAITELLSISENLAACGLIVPKWLVDKLEKFKLDKI